VTLAWADWRRLSRRPGPLAVVTVASVLPALLGAAFTGRAHGILIAAALAAGAAAAGLQGTANARRDMDSAALRRLLGVDPGQVLAARSVLPALLSTAWLALALTVLPAVGALSGFWWPLLGLAGPGVAAGALRLARTAPIDPSDRGPDMPMGNTPPWMVSRLISVVVIVIGSYPLLAAVVHGHASAGTVVSQILVSAIMLGLYLMIARATGR
jgi:VIT1/CCC1 family predicted Fe2+/Mn2+ transporter